MRIAYIVHDYHKMGGHSRYVAELATRFARDHEVHVFANKVEGDRDPRIRFHHVPALRFNALASVLTFILPATLRRLGSFDIVHAQGLCGLRQNVTTAHFCQPAWFCALNKSMGIITAKQRIFRALVEPIEKYIFQVRQSPEVIAVSKHTRSDLEYYYKRSENVAVIYHGVDLRTFHPDNRLRWRAEIRHELAISSDKFAALYVGNLQKGALAAIEAVARVDGARLILVTESDTRPYRIFAEKIDAANRVVFVPRTSKVERYFAAADVFVFPTLYDPYGMVISEAMATGLPVITSSAAGAAELIESGESGAIVDPPWNVEAIVEWLVRLKGDAALRESMGAAARAKIEHFTWDDTAIETMRVYEKVLAKRS